MQLPLALLLFSAVAGTAEVRNWLFRQFGVIAESNLLDLH